MIVYKNLKEKRWGKQRKYEHSVLRDIHLKDIRKSARNILIHPNIFFHTEFELLERIVLDHAIEAFIWCFIWKVGISWRRFFNHTKENERKR